MVYLTMLEKPVYHRSGAWEEYLARLHLGRPTEGTGLAALRSELREQLAVPGGIQAAESRSGEPGEPASP